VTTPVPYPPFNVHIPETASPQAQAFLRALTDPADAIRRWPAVDDLAGWKELQARSMASGKKLSEPYLKHYEPTIVERKLGGVGIFDLRPRGWKENGKIVVHVHNSVRVLGGPAATLGPAAGFAHETGLRLICVDHALAPHAKYNQMTDEIVAAISALLEEGQGVEDTAIEGRRRAGRRVGPQDARPRSGDACRSRARFPMAGRLPER